MQASTRPSSRRGLTAVTASPIQVQILNEGDYQKFRVPADLGSFGSLTTSAGVLPLQSMSLQGHVVGLLYHLKLVQRFYNPYGQPLEAVYIFPLPGRAAVSSFVMQTEQRRVVGRLEERGEARRQYQQAISQGKQAALAEEERSEVFTMTVGNIPPGQFVEIELDPALAPMAMLMTECSLSAGMKSASSSPSFMNSASCSTMSVCGVMGKDGTTSVLASFAA